MTDDEDRLTPPTNLLDYKKKKKIEKLAQELILIIKVYAICIKALSPFSKYTIVMETISVLQGNKTLLEIHLKKCETVLRSIKP